MRTSTTRKIALLIETSNAYARGLLHGIVSYIREHQPWSVFLSEHSRGDQPPAWLTKWDGHGVIARIENGSIAKAIRRLRIPVVDVSAARLIPSLPWVETDDAAIARVAAEHLIERGFRHLAFCGDDHFNWSKWRREHFERLVLAAGHRPFSFCLREGQFANAEAEVEAIGDWIVALPKPAGIMACYDFRGQQVLDACRRRGIRVPDDVAVIGVDNDELLCDLSDPPLSSVILNTQRTGYEAAALLDRMILGERIKPEARLIEPLGVATRQSTDALAIEDPSVVAVVRYIREHACEGISVKQVLQAQPQSRRLLESRFKKLIGRTPHEEIVRVRLNRAKVLLTESDLSLERISQLAGFMHVEYLSTVFKQKVGMPPSQYRSLNQRRSPAQAMDEDPAAPPLHLRR